MLRSHYNRRVYSMNEPQKGTCPVCNGAKRVPYTGEMFKSLSICTWYHPEDNTKDCDNCGGQYMYGKPTGLVPLNKAGEPCRHLYSHADAGRCYHRYTCGGCGDVYHIDSGD